MADSKIPGSIPGVGNLPKPSGHTLTKSCFSRVFGTHPPEHMTGAVFFSFIDM